MSNTQSHIIVKEEGICIYRGPDGSNFAENFQDGSGTGRYDDKGYQEAVKQAQASAILCEDQERARQIIRLHQVKSFEKSTNTKPDFSIKIGSIYPTSGIEFEEIETVWYNPSETAWQCKQDDCKETKTVARLIEHTAEKGESPETDREIPEPIAFANWIKENRFMPDVISGEWIRKFGYKDPEVKTTSELYHFFKVIEI